MTEDTRPVVVAFDGSAEAQAAARTAATLFRDRPVIVVSVWEPGLAIGMMSAPDATGLGYLPPSPEEIEMVDRAQREHATSAAEAGVALVRELGGIAEALPVPDSVNVADAVNAVADQRDAAALVVGSRGLGAVKSRFLGSTSRRLLDESRRPVLIVRAPG
jgi:nucleotide-binding universal stress UspA family protein